MRRRFGGGGRRFGQKRATQWYGATLGSGVSLAVNTYQSHLLLNPFTGLAGANPMIDPTLVRIRGAMSIVNNALAQTTVGAVGIIKTQLPPSGTLITGQLPDPYSAPEADWIFHSYFNAIGFSGILWNWAFQVPGTPIDSKAKRKMGDRDVLALVVANSSSSQNAILYTAGLRMLFQGQRR